MSIKPLDFQVMIPKTSEVSKIHNDEINKNTANLKQQASSMQQEAENNLKQVNSREKAHEGKIRENQEKSGKGSGKETGKGSEGKEPDKKDKEKKLEKKTSTIDIRL